MSAQSPRLTISPDSAFLPEPVSICAEGFEPGARITISARLVDDGGVVWRAEGAFVTDASGAADVAEAPSEGGTYSGIDAMGLFWSLQPESGVDRTFMINATERAHKLGQPALDPLKPAKFAFKASAQGSEASASLSQWRLGPGIDVEPVRDGRLRGMVFKHRARKKARGAIMSLTGSGGGVEMNYAPVLASLGYDVLSLAYFAYEDLPLAISSIPLEYFAEGFEWMRRELGASKIAVQGASRGGELTVVLAAYFPQYVVGAIPIVPMYASSPGWDPATGMAGPSWTWQGKDVPYAESAGADSYEDMKRIGDELPNGYPCTPWYLATMNAPKARAEAALPLERANGPILFISGEDDQMWPCTWGSNVAVDRLRAKGFKHSFRHLALRETGHLTPLPNTSTMFCQAIYHSLANVFLACGGTPQGTARSSRETWNAMKAHYRQIFEAP